MPRLNLTRVEVARKPNKDKVMSKKAASALSGYQRAFR